MSLRLHAPFVNDDVVVDGVDEAAAISAVPRGIAVTFRERRSLSVLQAGIPCGDEQLAPGMDRDRLGLHGLVVVLHIRALPRDPPDDRTSRICLHSAAAACLSTRVRLRRRSLR